MLFSVFYSAYGSTVGIVPKLYRISSSSEYQIYLWHLKHFQKFSCIPSLCTIYGSSEIASQPQLWGFKPIHPLIGVQATLCKWPSEAAVWGHLPWKTSGPVVSAYFGEVSGALSNTHKLFSSPGCFHSTFLPSILSQVKSWFSQRSLAPSLLFFV